MTIVIKGRLLIVERTNAACEDYAHRKGIRDRINNKNKLIYISTEHDAIIDKLRGIALQPNDCVYISPDAAFGKYYLKTKQILEVMIKGASAGVLSITDPNAPIDLVGAMRPGKVSAERVVAERKDGKPSQEQACTHGMSSSIWCVKCKRGREDEVAGRAKRP